MKKSLIIFFSLVIFSCNNPNNNRSSQDSVIYSSDIVPEKRATVNANALKTYSETIKSFETTDEFKVSLYETDQTFKFLIKISYKNLDAEDTLRVPNFGRQPQVDIIRGDSTRPSCIVGFLDAEKKFRESKLVYFENDMLKTHVLKTYGVFSK